MRFRDYIVEKYKPSGAELIKARKEMAKKWKTKENLLTYIGVQDERKTVGRLFLWFRIDDPKHKEYRSTKTYQAI